MLTDKKSAIQESPTYVIGEAESLRVACVYPLKRENLHVRFASNYSRHERKWSSKFSYEFETIHHTMDWKKCIMVIYDFVIVIVLWSSLRS